MSAPATVANRYRLDARLGAGGMSTVFRALDTVLERPVAVKLLAEHLADDDAFVARFRREALAAARLQHPNVVQVFDSGQDAASGRHYIVMEYVDGPSCADMLHEREYMDIDDSVRIVRDACRGLDYAHRAGVVHRDVKPGNLLLARETGTTKLADFGIAKAAEQSRITQVGSILGTAAYLSPEQARGEEADRASDIYSLGVCAYQFLTGRLPHEYSSLTELALKQQNEGVRPITDFRPEVPVALDRAVRLCLGTDPRDRYGSALEVADAMEAGLQGESTDATMRLEEHTRAFAMDDTDATQAMQRTSVVPPPRVRPVERVAPAPAPPARRTAAEEPDDGPSGGRRAGALLALLAVTIAIIAGVIALAGSESDNSGNAAIEIREDDVQSQVDRLREVIEDNAP